MWMHRGIRRVAYAALLVAGASALPPVQARAKAIAVLADGLGLPFPRPLAADVTRSDMTLDDVTGDLYSPGGEAPPMILLPGAAPKGRNDPRVVRIATALAKAERLVFVPDLELIHRRFVEEDIERIVRATVALEQHPDAAGPVTMLGFSYGGSFGLVAAADPRLRTAVGNVVTFGSYFDLLGVMQAATTGTSLVGERSIPWKADPRAPEVVRDVAVRLLPEDLRPELRRAFEGEAEPAALPSDARAVYELVANEDPAQTFALAEELPPDALARLRRFSPSTVAGDIAAPVLAMHSTDDPVVPFGELVRLEQGLPDAKTYEVSVFNHVDLTTGETTEPWALAGDVFRVWRFTGDMLSTQE